MRVITGNMIAILTAKNAGYRYDDWLGTVHTYQYLL